MPYGLPVTAREDEWLWGWDPTPGIVSVWAEPDGRALVWRRRGGALVREEARFRPWLVLGALDESPGSAGARSNAKRCGGSIELPAGVAVRELEGPGALRFLVSGDDLRALTAAVLRGASRRLERPVGHLREL